MFFGNRDDAEEKARRERELERRRTEQDMQGSNRLPPGQTLTLGFPVLTYGPNPPFTPATWDLKVFGEVQQQMRWTWDDFQKLPTRSIVCDIHCVTKWSKFDTKWEGVPFAEFIKLFGVKPSAKHVIAHCDYGYTTNVPLEDMLRDNILLAYKYDGKPLELDHGGPLRTLVPHLYFWKSAKFVRALEFSASDKPGFWEQGGYHNYGDPFREERYGRRGFF
jgi:DMSO/TMAO reductase YedYZ molybdopterin-dependent catalytic subunit